MPLIQKLKNTAAAVWNQKKKAAIAAACAFTISVCYHGFPDTMGYLWCAGKETAKFGADIFWNGAKRVFPSEDSRSYIKFEYGGKTSWLDVPAPYAARIEELANKYPNGSDVHNVMYDTDNADSKADGVATALNIENILLNKLNTDKTPRATIHREKPK
jgi:hypothetical protein